MLSSVSCVIPFEPTGVKDTAGILVVEGMILETGTTIQLSRTVSLNNDSDNSATSLEGVSDARIHVIDDNNQTIAVALLQNAGTESSVYVVQNPIIFSPGTKYALDIQIGAKHYQSAFVSPIRTPEIDEISWKQNEDNSLDILVSTHDPANETKYYRWEFDEDWEIRSRYLSEFRYEPNTGEIIGQSLAGSNNRYYCWASDKSKSILLGTSDKLTETMIKDRKILNIPRYSTRFSCLYSILVKQYGIDKTAYTYFENIQKNVEQGGSIFGLQPTELKGNIKCISHTDEPVIGYICATEEVALRVFINMETMRGNDGRNCDFYDFPFPADELDIAYGNYGLGIAYLVGVVYICAPIICVDCTKLGGSKNKPDFWPNDHQ